MVRVAPSSPSTHRAPAGPADGEADDPGRYRSVGGIAAGDRGGTSWRHDLTVGRVWRDDRSVADDGAVRQADPAADGAGQRQTGIDDILPLVSEADVLQVEDFASHHLPLEDASKAYEMFQKKQDGAVKVISSGPASEHLSPPTAVVARPASSSSVRPAGSGEQRPSCWPSKAVVCASPPATSEELDVVAADCRRRGARSVVVCATDMAVASDVDRLAEVAVRDLSTVDVWVNTASVVVAGDLVDCPVDDLERLVDTNVLGTMLTSRAVLAVFDVQGRGTLINTSSLLGLVPNPRCRPFCITKFAIRGLTIAVQQSAPPRAITVCVVVPGRSTRRCSPVRPITRAGGCGRSRRRRRRGDWRRPLSAAPADPARPRRPGSPVGLLLIGHRIAPGLTEWFVARTSASLLVRAGQEAATSGTLHNPRRPGHVDGGWRRWPVRVRLGDRLGRWSAARN